MSTLDNILKTIKSFKPVDIKAEIKNPSVISGGVRFQSPDVNNITFNEVQIDNRHLEVLVDKLSDKVIEGIQTQVAGKIASNQELQNQLSSLNQPQLTSYLKTTVSGTATISQLQPDFLASGGTVFPELGEVFQKGYEAGTKGRGQISNVKIYKTEKNGLVIQYDETD